MGSHPTADHAKMVRIPERLWRALKLEAVATARTLQTIVTEKLEDALRRSANSGGVLGVEQPRARRSHARRKRS